MRDTGLAHRYAEAVFNAATARGVVDEVAADLGSILAVADRDPTLRRVVESPQVTEERKHALVDLLFRKRAHALTVRLLHLLLEKKRALYLRVVARAYTALVDRQRGVVRAKVTTAVPLTADQLARLGAALESRTGKTVRLEPRLDREVIGGVIVQLGDQIVDDSVRTRLAELRDALLGAEV